jgi:hypothetical protein
MRWNGSAWESIATDLIGDQVDAIWGSGPDDVWASNGRALFRFDGRSWRQAASPPPPPASTSTYVYSISGSGPDDIWFGTDEGVYHWTAGGWVATVYLVGQKITFVSAASPSEVWAIDDEHLYRWNGTTFAEVTWPRANPLFQGVFAFATADVWVNDTGDYWHWDGQQFTIDTGFRTAAGFYVYYGLFITTLGDVWASGPAHRVSSGNWPGVPIDADAYSIPHVGAGLPDGQVWLGGTLGRLWRYANNRFDLAVPAVDPLTLGDLNAIWSDGNGTALAAGSILLRNSGNGWELAPHGSFGGSVNAMWGRSASDVWAVGNRAAVYHYDGTMWSPVDTGISSTLASSLDLFAVSGSDTGEIWALGHNGQVLHFDGQAWIAGVSASVSDMHAVWVHNTDDVWACGQNGIVQRWTRAGGWAQLTARPSTVTDYRTIWGTSESNVWIVPATSLAFRYDGAKWQNGAVSSGSRFGESRVESSDLCTVGERGWDVLGGGRERLHDALERKRVSGFLYALVRTAERHLGGAERRGLGRR